MRLAFIAGPYRAQHAWQVEENIQRAKAVARKYWQQGYAVICPHMNTALMGWEGDGDQVWLDGCLEMVRRCDVVVMMKRWGTSEGARGEFNLAVDLGKELVYDEQVTEVYLGPEMIDGKTTELRVHYEELIKTPAWNRI